jgi:molecular chaperone GrpE
MNDQHHGGPGRHGQRRRTRAEERIAELETPGAGLAVQVEDLKSQLEAAQQEAAENKAGWQRAMADMANFRRRTEQEREQMLGLANESLLRKLLAVTDDFDRAMGQMPPELAKLSWIEGLWVIDRKLRQLLESEGLTPIEAVGQPFDPREHDAIAHEATTTVPDGTVLDELQRGYRIRDRVLRPALVTVAKNESELNEDKDPTVNTDSGREAAGGKD